MQRIGASVSDRPMSPAAVGNLSAKHIAQKCRTSPGSLCVIRSDPCRCGLLRLLRHPCRTMQRDPLAVDHRAFFEVDDESLVRCLVTILSRGTGSLPALSHHETESIDRLALKLFEILQAHGDRAAVESPRSDTESTSLRGRRGRQRVPRCIGHRVQRPKIESDVIAQGFAKLRCAGRKSSPTRPSTTNAASYLGSRRSTVPISPSIKSPRRRMANASVANGERLSLAIKSASMKLSDSPARHAAGIAACESRTSPRRSDSR